MTFNKKHLRNIISANNDNSLAIFIGAGISKSSSSDILTLPSWNDLIIDLKNELEIKNENDYLKIAQLYFLEFGEHTYYKKIKEYFPDYIKPSKIHKIIFDINPHVIITTNWDNILEKTVEENAYIYDTICSDTDLIKSSLQNKLIKMHGDFKNHNIIFKEDDYINYQFHFPLIENYVRSILSTHTILFLGYSYNDYNLKQIIKWVRNHSNVRPPMYLTVFRENKTQSKYLENHGITTLLLEEESAITSLDVYSNKVYAFLEKIKNFDEVNTLETDEEVVSYLYNRIKVLNDLNSIMIEQVEKIFTNVDFLFDEDLKYILDFGIHIKGFNPGQEHIYTRLISILERVEVGEKPSEFLIKIFTILYKANIKGIVLTKVKNKYTYLEFEKYINIVSSEVTFDMVAPIDEQSLELSTLFENAYNYYHRENYPEAFKIVEDAISICLKQKNYTWLFIGMFNRNVLLQRLKFTNVATYTAYEKYDLFEKYSNLPKDLKNALEPVYNFLDFSLIYKYIYTTSVELTKTEEEIDIIKNGGMVLNKNEYKSPSRHKNILSFVLKNKIMIETYKEYVDINRNFLKISIFRLFNKNELFKRHEIYASVKYFKNEELKKILNDYHFKDSDKRGRFKISKEDKDWLIKTMLVESVKLLVKKDKLFSSFERNVKNIIFLLSLLELNQNDINQILAQINLIIKRGEITISLFETFNQFLGLQYNLHNPEISDKFVRSIIDSLINKFISAETNGIEFSALRYGISNIFGLADIKSISFENEYLINNLILHLDQFPVKEKLEFSESFLINIYNIGNETVQRKIKEYLAKIDTSELNNEYVKISFTLTMIINDLATLDISIIDNLNQFMTEYETGQKFSSLLYKLDSQIDFLIKEKNLEELTEISDKIKKSISIHKESDSTFP